jgi:L-ascorbate metabolism protein UlaG (beta-lactamase superfamily)
MRLRWLGTAGFELISEDTSVLIDPYLTRNARARPRQDLTPFDFAHARAIFITHGHFDHAYDVPQLVKVSGAPVYASPTVCQALATRGVPWNKLRPLWQWKRAKVEPFVFGALPSRHITFDPQLVLSTLWKSRSQLLELSRLGAHRFPTGEVFGWLIEVEGKKLLHLGSACMTWGVSNDIDIFMVPVQGRTDIAEVAADLVKRVKPKLVIPQHFDDFYPPISRTVDLAPFKARLGSDSLKAAIRTPEINTLVEL